MKMKSKISLALLVFSFFTFSLMAQDLSSENQLSEKTGGDDWEGTGGRQSADAVAS